MSYPYGGGRLPFRLRLELYSVVIEQLDEARDPVFKHIILKKRDGYHVLYERPEGKVIHPKEHILLKGPRETIYCYDQLVLHFGEKWRVKWFFFTDSPQLEYNNKPMTIDVVDEASNSSAKLTCEFILCSVEVKFEFKFIIVQESTTDAGTRIQIKSGEIVAYNLQEPDTRRVLRSFNTPSSKTVTVDVDKPIRLYRPVIAFNYPAGVLCVEVVNLIVSVYNKNSNSEIVTSTSVKDAKVLFKIPDSPSTQVQHIRCDDSLSGLSLQLGVTWFDGRRDDSQPSLPPDLVILDWDSNSDAD